MIILWKGFSIKAYIIFFISYLILNQKGLNVLFPAAQSFFFFQFNLIYVWKHFICRMKLFFPFAGFCGYLYLKKLKIHRIILRLMNNINFIYIKKNIFYIFLFNFWNQPTKSDHTLFERIPGLYFPSLPWVKYMLTSFPFFLPLGFRLDFIIHWKMPVGQFFL